MSGWLNKLGNKDRMNLSQSIVFVLLMLFILLWLVTGLLFQFSTPGRLVAHAATSLGILLLLFWVERKKNKQSLDLQRKLDELVAATKGTSSRLVSLEELTEEELSLLQRHYAAMSALTKEIIAYRKAHPRKKFVRPALKSDTRNKSNDSWFPPWRNN